MPQRSLALLVVLFLSPLAGCDRIQALVGGGDAAATKPDEKKEVAKDGAEAAPGKAEAPAKTSVAAASAPVVELPPTPAPAAEAAAPAAVPAAASPTEAAATPATAQPCIVGNWVATDYMARIDRAMRADKDLAKLTYKSHTGTIGYVIDPPQADKKGLVRAKASEYTYRYAGKVEGFDVSLVLVMNGDTEAEYELAEPSRIVVGKPKSDTMKVKASAKVAGLGSASQSKRVGHHFDGDFTYACSETELQVWDDPAKKGRPIKFARKQS